MMRVCFSLPAWLAALVFPVSGQLTGLATPFDGSVVYFASTLRLKGSNQPNHGKLFVADESGVRLLRSRDRADPPPNGPACTVGTLFAFTGAETSADGRTIVASMQGTAASGCSYPPFVSGADLITPATEADLPGIVRISPSGRYAIELASVTARPTEQWRATLLDLRSGTQTPVALPPLMQNQSRRSPDIGRIVADDGAVIVAYFGGAFVIRPGAGPQAFPVPDALPLAIDASGTRVLYRTDALRILDLRTQDDRLLLEDAAGVAAVTMSDDTQRVLFLRGGQAWTADASGVRALTSDASGVSAATLSGSGRIAYAVTREGRLLKIDVEAGSQTEILGRTPYLTNVGFADAGFTAVASGGGLSDLSLQATPPLPFELGGVRITAGGRSAPIAQVTPTSVSFLVPWDAYGDVTVIAATNDTQSRFDLPEAIMSAFGGPRAGAIAHQNWDGLVTIGAPSPPRLGEIIHVWAVGLGAVSPDPPAGTVAPSAEPLARLASPMVCSNADVLYAGLAPGYVERVYQVDIRLNTAGYLQFKCSIGGSPEFIFLTLLVVP